MIRTTVVGSWPPEEKYQQALTAYFQGDLAAQQESNFLLDVASAALAQQKACGLDEYTGGETSADSFILHFPKYFSGIERTGDEDAWDGRGDFLIVGELDAPDGLGIAAAFRREKRLDPALQKVTIPGPSEILMMIGPEEANKAARPKAIELIRREISECVAVGATDVQLDLPHVAMGTADGWWDGDAAGIIRQIFAGFEDIRRSVHFCFGDFQAQTWTDNRYFRPLLPLIRSLDGIVDRLVLEFSLPEQWAERPLLADIPASMEIAIGLVDVKSPEVQTPEALAAQIEELLRYVPAERLLICPSCGFGRRHVAMAVDKTTAMVGAVKLVNGRLTQ
ncbi:MAG: hypothetical protein AAF614_32935 [Chloroflexota bacterium]